jgi:uncharacterized membrane protein
MTFEDGPLTSPGTSQLSPPVLPVSLLCGFVQSVHRSLDISPDQTFGELSLALDNDDDAEISDFWCKKIDHEQNGVTPSGVTWERQDSCTRVLDVFMKKKNDGQKESLGIEKVTKDGEYIIALVLKDGKEFPLSISRSSLVIQQ